MYFNTLEVTITPRTHTGVYNVQLNKRAFDILSLIFEFKVATAWQVTRFLKQKDMVKYLYLKLHRMWQGGLLESFKVYQGTRAGMPVYYVLSKQGITVLQEEGVYEREQLKTYPHLKTLLSLNLFKHEAGIVELASLEAKNSTGSFPLTFKGEISGGGKEFLSNKNIEVLTPDYIVRYPGIGREEIVYTEFERTPKSKEASLRKLEHYANTLTFEVREHATVRLIFQSPRMEELFWLNLLTNGRHYLHTLRIRTTNVSLLKSHEHFMEPVYSSGETVRLTKEGRLGVETGERIKLFSFV